MNALQLDKLLLSLQCNCTRNTEASRCDRAYLTALLCRWRASKLLEVHVEHDTTSGARSRYSWLVTAGVTLEPFGLL
jgi:hypothetical protein